MLKPPTDHRTETEKRFGSGEPPGTESGRGSEGGLREGRRGPSLRTQRLKLTWLLAIPFLVFARPTPESLTYGGVLSVLGLLIRGVAAGCIHKDRELARGGPYGHLRHPLYLGSFLVGTGISAAGGVWWFLPAFIVLFLWVYGRVIVEEERQLRLRFGSPYREYQEQVPAFIPRILGRAPPPSGSGFRVHLYLRNKEWQAASGVAAGFLLLFLKMMAVG